MGLKTDTTTAITLLQAITACEKIIYKKAKPEELSLFTAERFKGLSEAVIQKLEEHSKLKEGE